jgi:hypothetical protein
MGKRSLRKRQGLVDGFSVREKFWHFLWALERKDSGIVGPKGKVAMGHGCMFEFQL